MSVSTLPQQWAFSLLVSISTSSTLGMAFISSLAGFFASASFLSVLYYPHYFYVTALIITAKKLISDENMTSQVEFEPSN